LRGSVLSRLSSGLEFDHLQYGFFTDDQPDVNEPGRRAWLSTSTPTTTAAATDEASMITDAQGRYRFEGLLPATYTVRLDLPGLGRGCAAGRFPPL
jgi:hypothetical protein